MRTFVAGVLMGAWLLALPERAAADLFAAPYAGVNFGGSTVDPRANVGLALTWMGRRGLGLEADIAFVPDFFDPRDSELDLLGSNHVTTVMGNVVVAHPYGPIRPYLVVGAGLIRSQIGEFGDFFDATNHGVGVDAGGGVLLGAGRFAIRADLRYLRQLSGVDRLLEDALTDFAFWRASGGLAIRF